MSDAHASRTAVAGAAGILHARLPSLLHSVTAEAPTLLADLHCDSEAMVGVAYIPAGSTDHFWERHEGGDEMLVVLSGEALFTASAPEGELESVTARCGDIVLLRRGQAHRAQVFDDLRVLFVTPKLGNSSWTDTRDARPRH